MDYDVLCFGEEIILGSIKDLTFIIMNEECVFNFIRNRVQGIYI